jgi:glycosyltransferase involved in cell wall biosynthesis
VVTNADEVEDVFKIDLPPEDLALGGPYEPRFGDGGHVRVDSTGKPDRKEIYYIPLGNPTVSRLVSRALKAIEDEGCDVIFSQYLEPYGVAASIVSAWTGVPFVFKHAGSDLYRLMKVPDLQPCYREVLCRAHRVITAGVARQVVRSHGVSDARIASGFGFGLPKVAFHPAARRADLDEMLESARSRWAPAQNELASLVAPLEPGLPTLGIYGKLGEQKGTFDLLNAARLLIDRGFRFQLVVVGRGWQEAEFGRRIAELGLARYVRMHPFIPHWSIPGFIRACDAIAFLERDFEIRAHTPTIPSEVLSCGACLIVSQEVLRKQMFRAGARQRENLVVVRDPRDHHELARAIGYALEDPDRASRIGRAGVRLTESLPDLADYVDWLEKVLQSVIGEPAPVRVRTHIPAESEEERLDPANVVKRLYPYTAALLGACTEIARAALSGSMIGSKEVGPREFAMAVGERLSSALDGIAPGHVLDVCRYELLMHTWAAEREGATTDSASSAEAFERGYLPGFTQIGLRSDIAIEAFDHDVEELALLITSGESIPVDSASRFRRNDPLLVLFCRGSFPQRISRSTAALLLLLREQSMTVDEVRAKLSEALRAEPGEVDIADLAGILQGLFWEGIVGVESNFLSPDKNSPLGIQDQEILHEQEA